MQLYASIRMSVSASATLFAVLLSFAAAGTPNPLASRARYEEPTARLMVVLHARGSREATDEGGERLRGAIARSGVAAAGSRPLTARIHVVHLPGLRGGPDLADAMDALRADPEVASVEPDRRKFAQAVPSDTDFPNQWYWTAAQPAAVNAEAAWDVTTGSTGTVIAVLDTGVRFDHPDLLRASAGGRLLAGYDFVGPDSDGGFLAANDGDGWDSDPSDPGDWISQSDVAKSLFKSCTVGDSSWHGTRTAGLIGALTNNASGIAGGTWKPWILPVRVLGKCGGYDSDIQSAMLWAAGISVPGAPTNAFPARIENLSLGGKSGDPCGSYQAVVDEVTAAGVLVVVSAGNDGTAVSPPANCRGVVAVAGLRHVGTKVGYSSLGPEVALGAPAGNCGAGFVNGGPCLYSIDTTTNLGTTAPGTNGYTDQYNYNIGTSFSAPIVTAIAGLMHAVNGNLKPAQFVARLKEGTTPYPTTSADAAANAQPPACVDPATSGAPQDTECVCTTTTCGAGMASAPGAVRAAQRPIAAVLTPASVSAGGTVTLDASGSAAACGRQVAGYAWTATPATTALSAATGARTSLTAPASGSVIVHLTVTDDAGRTDTTDITVSATAATSAAPASAGSRACPAAVDPNPPPPSTTPPPTNKSSSSGGGGGGGGGLACADLLLFGALAGWRRRRAPVTGPR